MVLPHAMILPCAEILTNTSQRRCDQREKRRRREEAERQRQETRPGIVFRANIFFQGRMRKDSSTSRANCHSAECRRDIALAYANIRPCVATPEHDRDILPKQYQASRPETRPTSLANGDTKQVRNSSKFLDIGTIRDALHYCMCRCGLYSFSRRHLIGVRRKSFALANIPPATTE